MRLRVFLYTVVALLLAGLAMSFAALGTMVVEAQPSPPVLVSPSNGGTIVTPTFVWNAVAGAARYDIQVSADESFTSPAWSESTTDLTITPVSTLANGSLWWRVRSVDASGGVGPWSVPWGFTKQIPAPVPSSPSDGAMTVIPTFRWKMASGAAYYRMQVASNNTFTNIVWQDDIYGLSVTPVSALPNGILYWRLWSVDTDGHPGESTTTWSFTKQIPAPSLVSPADGAGIITPMFEWQTIAGATYYHIQVATNNAFTAVVWQADTYDSRITPVSTLPNGTLYWRVWGVDADGHGGDISASRTVVKQISMPALVSPDNGTTVTTPTFRWQPVEGAAYYHIQVATNPTFTSIAWESDTYNPVITPVTDLSPGVRYWRVLGVDADGHEGGYSDYRSLTLEAPLRAAIRQWPFKTLPATPRWLPTQSSGGRVCRTRRAIACW